MAILMGSDVQNYPITSPAPANTYRLSELERRLVVSWNLCADLSVREIAKRADIREHRVRHALENLINRGLVTPMYLIDNYRLGYSDYGIFFSPSAETSDLRVKFEKSLEDHPRVVWVARLSGSFQYGATFLGKQPHELVDFFARMQPLSLGAYAQKTIRIGVETTWFSPNYLAPEVKERNSVSITTREGAPFLSDSDKKILVAMTENPKSSVAQLSKVAGLNASSLAYRIEKLRNDKIVRGRMYSVANHLLGIFMYRIMIVDCGLTSAQRNQLYAMCAACPNVVAYVVCTGSWDFEIRFETEYPEQMDYFCQRLIDTFGKSVGSILVSHQLNTLKRSAHPKE